MNNLFLYPAVLVPNHKSFWHLGCAKAPGLSDRVSPNAKNFYGWVLAAVEYAYQKISSYQSFVMHNLSREYLNRVNHVI